MVVRRDGVASPSRRPGHGSGGSSVLAPVTPNPKGVFIVGVNPEAAGCVLVPGIARHSRHSRQSCSSCWGVARCSKSLRTTEGWGPTWVFLIDRGALGMVNAGTKGPTRLGGPWRRYAAAPCGGQPGVTAPRPLPHPFPHPRMRTMCGLLCACLLVMRVCVCVGGWGGGSCAFSSWVTG